MEERHCARPHRTCILSGDCGRPRLVVWSRHAGQLLPLQASSDQTKRGRKGIRLRNHHLHQVLVDGKTQVPRLHHLHQVLVNGKTQVPRLHQSQAQSQHQYHQVRTRKTDQAATSRTQFNHELGPAQETLQNSMIELEHPLKVEVMFTNPQPKKTKRFDLLQLLDSFSLVQQQLPPGQEEPAESLDVSRTSSCISYRKP